MEKVNYDNVAEVYEYRYQSAYSIDGIPHKLQNIEKKYNIKTVLEVGCGTGHWLNVFKNDPFVIGIDASPAMLSKANTPESSCYLVQGLDNRLPIKNNSIDFIYCVNAIHHFEDPEKFIHECKPILTQNGILSIICMNPHAGLDNWFIYDFFSGTLEKDLQRYPSPVDFERWLHKAGFTEITLQIGERLQNRIIGEDIFPLPKEYTSQLSLMNDHEYEMGIKKIRDFMDFTCSKNKIPEFNVDISLSMVTARISR
ncbi:methyltransferase domain-containing protein [bacterium]|nr:methyltransferase domain-containing protein [bacterium]